MIIEKEKFYKSRAWYHKRKEIIKRDGGVCSSCGGITRLIVHHIKPIPWIDGQVEVETINELLECPLETLCIYCHNQMERSNNARDEMYWYLKGIEIEER